MFRWSYEHNLLEYDIKLDLACKTYQDRKFSLALKRQNLRTLLSGERFTAGVGSTARN